MALTEYYANNIESVKQSHETIFVETILIKQSPRHIIAYRSMIPNSWQEYYTERYKEKTNQSWIIIMLYNRIKQSSKLKLKGS